MVITGKIEGQIKCRQKIKVIASLSIRQNCKLQAMSAFWRAVYRQRA